MITGKPASYADVMQSRGICCPKCECRHMPAIKSMPQENGSTKRIRQCRNCGHRIWSEEQIIGAVIQRKG